MPITERLELRRFPVVTAVVLAVTAVMNGLQFAVPSVLRALQRTPAGLHGDWWRTATALFVQDGGVFGTLSNLAFLAVIGGLAEQVLPRPRWLLAYFGAGMAAELVAYAWQPRGAGNSIAICALTCAVALAQWRRDARLPGFGPYALVLWSGALLATWLVPLVIVAALGPTVVGAAARRGVPGGRIAAAVVLVTAVVLSAVRNIHGAALVLGVLVTYPPSRP